MEFNYFCGMKSRFVIIFSAFLLAMPYIVASPQARWLSTEHNFGAFNEESGVVTTTFRVVNTGDEPLVILAARANCGCTTPTYRRDPIAPGDTAFVSVGFNPAGRIGRFEKYVLVDTNSPVLGTSDGNVDARSRQQLKITGTVIGASNTVSGRYPAGAGALKLHTDVAAFGQVPKGKLATVSLAGYNRSSDSIDLSVTGLPEYISAVVRPVRVAPGEMFNIVLSLSSHDCPEWGIVTGSAKLEGSDAADVVTLSTVGIITDDFSNMTARQRAEAPVIELSSDVIDFGSITNSSGRLRRKLTVTNRGKSMLRVRRVYTTDSYVSFSRSALAVKPGKSADIEVEVDTSALEPPMLNTRIMLITNDPAAPQMPVRVIGEVKDV